MSSYITIILYTIILFPFIALIITLPFMIINYHKYGSVSFFRTLIVYTFILYLLCALFLVIFPLPSKEYVLSLNIPRTQLIPFHFIVDFFQKSGFVYNDFNTYLSSLKTSLFYQPLFNILLTIPFGVYLRYYYKFSKTKTIIYTFLLSLFFEITQLTGLYWIYPRNYRIFDVDDIMFNTLGGYLGFLIGGTITKPLPSREEIDVNSYIKGMKVSYIRRFISYMLDIFILLILLIILYLIFNSFIKAYIISTLLLFIGIPFIFKGQTIGKMITSIKVDADNKINIYFDYILEYLFYYIDIILMYYFSDYALLIISIMFIIYLINLIRLFKREDLWYQYIAKTKIISTIKIKM
jgi:glycopeptide antibiotics resistance protein